MRPSPNAPVGRPPPSGGGPSPAPGCSASCATPKKNRPTREGVGPVFSHCTPSAQRPGSKAMTQMSPAEAIFFDALEKTAAAERAAYLDRACGGDALLRRRVERLLAAHPLVGSCLEPPAAPVHLTPTGGSGPAETTVCPAADEGGVVLAGRYTLLEPIGEGGMGTVRRARQTEPVRRLVAVKLIKPGMDSRQVLARFEQERQALALMDHPNIARVFDGGTTESGRPYFVMELVQGVAITQFCDEH